MPHTLPDPAEVLAKLNDLEDKYKDKLHVEFGSSNHYQCVSWSREDGKWYWQGTDNKPCYLCDTLLEALECLINPPNLDEYPDYPKTSVD